MKVKEKKKREEESEFGGLEKVEENGSDFEANISCVRELVFLLPCIASEVEASGKAVQAVARRYISSVSGRFL